MADTDLTLSPPGRGLPALRDRVDTVLVAVMDTIAPAMAQSGIDTTDIPAGLEQLSIGTVELAASAHRAATSGVSFAQAVHDDESFPKLCTVYNSALDVLALSLPPDLERFLRTFIRMTPTAFGPALRRYAVSAAHQFEGDYLGSLARFMLFVGVRVNLAVIQRSTTHDTTLVGLADELDEQAELAVAEYLSHPDLLEEPIEPMKAMVALACSRCLPLVGLLARGYAEMDAETRHPYERRAALEAELAELDIGDALLIKKHAGDRLPMLGVFGDNQPRMTNRRLRQLHPVVFEDKSDDAMNMRLDRIKKKVGRQGLKTLKRKGPTMLDVLGELHQGDEP
jgi:hypothetical protein